MTTTEILWWLLLFKIKVKFIHISVCPAFIILYESSKADVNVWPLRTWRLIPNQTMTLTNWISYNVPLQFVSTCNQFRLITLMKFWPFEGGVNEKQIAMKERKLRNFSGIFFIHSFRHTQEEPCDSSEKWTLMNKFSYCNLVNY